MTAAAPSSGSPGPPSASPGSRVVVVGGGISGLAAAVAVRRRLPDAQVTVLEGSPRVGGKLARAEVAGVTLDVGAEAILNRRPEGVALVQDAGLGEDLVHPATTAANLWSRGRMVLMPRSVMGVPLDSDELAESGVVSEAGLARAAEDLWLPATEIGDRDVSAGWLVEQRFGPEVVDRLVEPLLGGVYAGHARELSARATVPQVVALLGRDPSMMRAAAASTPAPDAPAVPVFAGIVGGVGRLAQALSARADLDVRTSTTVREIARGPHGGWSLVVGATPAPEVVSADAVVLATPAAPTARLLADVVPAAARELERIEYASMAVVTLAFPRAAFPRTRGSGFLVPPVDRRGVKAATFSFAKWAWVEEAGRDSGVVLMRCSLGRHREERSLQADDEELVRRALADLADAIGVSGHPVDAHVQRWGGGLPQYAVGHLDRVARIRAAVEEAGSLAVCGAVYEGLGIPACIASAEKAAAQVVEALAAPLPRRGQ